MNSNLTSQNRIEPIYQTQLIYLIVWGAFIGIGLSLFNISVLTLFMESRLGNNATSGQEGIILRLMDDLASAIFFAGCIGLVISILFIYLQIYFPFSRLAMIFLMLVSGAIFYLYQGIFLNTSYDAAVGTGFVFWSLVLLFVLNSFCLLTIEGIFARLFNIQLIKKFTHRAGIGVIAASFFTALLVWGLGKGVSWDAETKMTCLPILNILFWGSGLAFLLAFVILSFITFKFKTINYIQEDIKEVQAQNTFLKLLEDPYVIVLAVFMMLSVSIGVLIDYLFLSAFGFQHTEMHTQPLSYSFKRGEFFSFLSIFIAFVMLLSMTFKTFLYRYLIQKYNLRIGLWILPGALFVFLGIAWLTVLVNGLYYLDFHPEKGTSPFLFFFIMILIGKLVKDTLSESIEMSVYRLYLLPIPLDLRYDIQMKLEGFVRQLAVWFSGVLLLFFLNIRLNLVLVILLIWVLILGSIYAVWVLYKEYKRKLENTLEAEQAKASLSKLSLADHLLVQIHEVHPSQIATYLNILNILNPVLYRQAILKLLDSSASELKDSWGVIDHLYRKTNHKLNQTILQVDATLRHKLWSKDFENQVVFEDRPKRSLDQKMDEILEAIHQKLKTNLLDTQESELAHRLEFALKELKSGLKEDIRQLPLNIQEEIQSVALKQASRLCILEAIPMLDIISKSRYFPILDNADLIRECLETLISAEKRLERSRYIEQLTQSTLISERIFGSLLTIYSSDAIKNKLILRLTQNPSREDYPVTYQALVAASSSKNPEIYGNLIEKLDNPHFSHAAFAAIVSIGEKIFDALESAFYMTGQSETIQLRIIQIYGRIGMERAVKLLLDKLDYKNQNVSSLALNTLSECGHKIDDQQLRQKINAEVQEICQILVWNMAVIRILERFVRDASENPLMDAMESEIKNNYEKIFSLLALLYEPRSVALVRENLYSNNPEQAEFALELLDVLLAETIKPILLPLLNTSTSYSEKIKNVSSYFIVEDVYQMSPEELLIVLIQRDYKWINRWTKACALSELSQRTDFKDPSIFLANTVNPDIILREIAFDTLSRHYPESLSANIQKMNPFKGSSLVPELVQELQKNHQKAAYLKFQMADFLRSVPELEEISGLVLSEIAKIMEIIDCKIGENILLKSRDEDSYNTIEEMDYFMVYSGSVFLYTDKIVIRRYTSGGFINDYPYINQHLPKIKIVAESDALIFKIPREQFNEIISLYDEIPLSILNQSQKMTQVMLKLHESGLISKTNSLSFAEITKAIELKEYAENEIIAAVDFQRDLDHYVLYSGELSLLCKNREINRFSRPLSLISPQVLPNPQQEDIKLRARSDASLYHILPEELQRIDELLNKAALLKKVPEFREINDLTLIEISEKINAHEYREGEQIAFAENIHNLNCLINLSKIRMRYTRNEKQEEKEIEAFHLIHSLKFLEEEIKDIYIEAMGSQTKIFWISKENFDRLLNLYDQLVLDILKIHYSNTLSVIIRHLQKVYSFRKLSALEMLEVARLVIIKQYQAGDRIASYTSLEEMDLFMVYSGKIDLMIDKMVIREFGAENGVGKEADLFLHHHIQTNRAIQSLKISAQQDCIVYTIRRSHLDQLFAKYYLPLNPIYIPINTNQLIQRDY